MEYVSLVLNFIVSLVTSWPFVILVIVVFFHQEIGQNVTKIFDLLTRLKSFSAGDKSVTFSEQLEVLNENKSIDIENENNDIDKQIDVTSDKLLSWGFTPLEEFDKLSSIRPDFAILDSWRPIETRLYQISQDNKIVKENQPPLITLRRLHSTGQIKDNQYNYIMKLMKLRNNIVHNEYQSITLQDAYLYRKNCIEAMKGLDSVIPL